MIDRPKGRQGGAWVALASLLFAAACGGGAPMSPVGIDGERSAAAARRALPPPPVSGHMVASVGERAIGPFFVRRGEGASAAGLVAWVTVAEGWSRRLIVVPIGADGAPRGPQTLAANVAVDTTMLVVGAMRGSEKGFVVTWTSLTDRGEALWSVALGDDGKPRGKPVELARTTDDIVWAEVIPTDVGAVVLWAEETEGGDANLLAARLQADGKVRGAPTRVARGVVGWHAIELGEAIGLSTVTLPPGAARPPPGAHGSRRDEASGGALSFRRLDPDGHPVGEPAVLVPEPVVGGDVEVVRAGARLVFAWTDRSAEEPFVTVAALEGDRLVVPPRKTVDAFGGAALMGLASGSAGVAVMFEAPPSRRGERRRVHVARLGAELTLEGRALSFEAAGEPELAATSSGFAVLASEYDCSPGSRECASAEALATLLRTDASGGVVQREVLDFKTDPATLGWGMACDGDTCFTLTASPGPPGTPSRVRAATVRPRVNVQRAEPPPEAPKDGPQVAFVTALGSGERVLDIATARLGEGHLVATLAGASTGPTSPSERGSGLTLSTRVVGDDGVAADPVVISTKALHVGGVALARAGAPEDGGALAWVAREGDAPPQVYVARLDARGRRTKSRKLTTTKGSASDVTITWAGDGWIIGWVDGRDGNGEVYATKLSLDLSSAAREVRITKAPGDASDLVALARGELVWLAWADPRESPADGAADIFVSAVRARDATPAFAEQRLLPTIAHSRTPALANTRAGVHVAWIEEAPLGSATPTASGYGAFVALLDESGKPADKPERLPLAGEGAATAVTLDVGAGLRAVVARSTPDLVGLDAIDLAASPPRAAALLALDGPPSLDVTLVLEGSALFFNDDGPRVVDRRARRASIRW